MASDIAMLGCPQNYDAGPGDSSLKTWAKFPARTALKQGAVVFFESVARRLHESACFSQMERTECNHINYAEVLSQRQLEAENKHEVYSDSDSQTATINTNVTSELVGLPKFVVYLNDDTQQLVQSKWLGKQKQKKLVELHPLVLNWIRKESILDANHPKRMIERYTEYVRNGVRFRAHPNYRSDGPWHNYPKRMIEGGYTEYVRNGVCFRAHPNYRSNGPWHDLVMVAFSADGTNPQPVVGKHAKTPPCCFDPYAPPFGEQYYPCSALAFSSIPNKVDITQQNRVVAVVHLCETRLATNEVADTRLLQVWSLEYDNKVNTSASNNPIIGVDGNTTNNYNDKYRLPLVREVDVNSFDERGLAIEENPGNHEQLLCKRNTIETVRSRTVFLVENRDNSWAQHYLNWDSDKTRNYETAKVQAS
jgi:hypothetical protein